ncbi:hypothetical protein L484_004385 [Morus notabilis]|uniref:Uncharacterized protein n=1 Tax=Morus notabilis TaxID=981085 RepID=W9RTT0_9ROSA|nr:hypothetical protein L484_004385 [Morus notabilis]
MKLIKLKGPTGSRTQVAGFKVQSANHYTMEPMCGSNYEDQLINWYNLAKAVVNSLSQFSDKPPALHTNNLHYSHPSEE